MRISILTLFPQMFDGPFKFSIIQKAIDKKLIDIEIVDIRDFGIGVHKSVDDKPYGGGKGMVFRVDVVYKALIKVKNKRFKNTKSYLLSASGAKYKQAIANDLSKLDHLILICGHYEGIDQRIENFIDGSISVGDFITTGGEIPAMIIADSVARLVPGVLDKSATENESFSLKNEEKYLLEYPQFTRPEEFRGHRVPNILLSGNHKQISEFKNNASLELTKKLRPDLLKD